MDRSHRLTVWEGDHLVFSHDGRWLHPLFALEEFLRTSGTEVSPGWLLVDKVVGRAAAFLIVGMGFQKVRSPVVSHRAGPVFAAAGIRVETDQWVPRIDCQTEDLLAEVTDPASARSILEERRRWAIQRFGS